MKIVNNLRENHYNYILKIAKDADTLYLISPFLMESFDTILSESVVRDNIKRIKLVKH